MSCGARHDGRLNPKEVQTHHFGGPRVRLAPSKRHNSSPTEGQGTVRDGIRTATYQPSSSGTGADTGCGSHPHTPHPRQWGVGSGERNGGGGCQTLDRQTCVRPRGPGWGDHHTIPFPSRILHSVGLQSRHVPTRKLPVG